MFAHEYVPRSRRRSLADFAKDDIAFIKELLGDMFWLTDKQRFILVKKAKVDVRRCLQVPFVKQSVVVLAKTLYEKLFHRVYSRKTLEGSFVHKVIGDTESAFATRYRTTRERMETAAIRTLFGARVARLYSMAD